MASVAARLRRRGQARPLAPPADEVAHTAERQEDSQRERPQGLARVWRGKPVPEEQDCRPAGVVQLREEAGRRAREEAPAGSVGARPEPAPAEVGEGREARRSWGFLDGG